MVTVAKDLPGGFDSRWHLLCQVRAKRLDLGRVRGGRVGRVLKPASVGQEMGQGYRLWITLIQLKSSEVLIDIGVQVEFTPFHQLHDSRGHK